ncbi:TraR/DksA C4-type zinc finger protein [Vibrio aestuarianus]|uniref:TraR/DksA C4-type zinc finger protein n=1 Tax=Vibrio aestuarianus TaxID=28171 RepID=UPI001446F362|nr:TraR/DksA C4-type zinc finger protein [Vibrio aestuarianus]MDE1213765.1 TraR/DksA C4-type zinc finger protein [Vibrio aestuarianus]MDE1217222.1 TraR/DksA C4-type zinc finger protein [Vibrio aestuarianus]MDE1256962.1 TraR/DksA C4-type zinc finger protein [Vibrio aestuarianus]MDE1260763.1 TraR/DksA C4-type zinc finger protein [Vibrio aestuarianus]MDE1267559.1 TraR/DksA C4-type zinc finger protein [Vibrio aestuarianus]
MADVIDVASDTEAKFQQVALANQLARAGSALRQSRSHCLGCDEEIPQARRKAIAGCQYCTPCQAKQE